MISKKLPLLLLILIGMCFSLAAQVNQQALANEYYKKGDYDKAATLYEELLKDQPGNNTFYKMYYQSMMALTAYEDLEKFLKKRIKKFPNRAPLRVDLGYVYSQMGEEEKMRAQYEEALETLGPNRGLITQLANAYSQVNEYEWSIKTYEKGRELLGPGVWTFNYDLAGLYYRKGDIPKMITAYLDFASENRNNLNTVQNAFQRYLDDDAEFEELQTQLYQRIQRFSNDSRWAELLIWNFQQMGDWESAFIQVKALDRKAQEPGRRVFNFAQEAQIDENWDVAIDAYEYLVKMGPQMMYFYSARSALLSCRRSKVLNGDYDVTDLEALREEYFGFLEEYNRPDVRSANTRLELAYLEAYYLHDLESAINQLEQIIDWPSLNPGDQARIKLELGDYYLMSGDVWESTLLYSQVDKSMKDEPLGEEARFKNARLSYFNGDFEWAQAQLQVLKASTSELVANDALRLSVFITENLGLDSILTPMEIFSRAELLAFQNRNDEATLTLDSLDKAYPGHMLSDNILYLRSDIAWKERRFEDAANHLEKIREQYFYDILADDAIFLLGKLYQEKLGRPDDAMECFQSIMLDYKDSVYVIEARKRFRELRGDDIN
jgi:tetratricopeptide (TPR) repeat protein